MVNPSSLDQTYLSRPNLGDKIAVDPLIQVTMSCVHTLQMNLSIVDTFGTAEMIKCPQFRGTFVHFSIYNHGTHTHTHT